MYNKERYLQRKAARYAAGVTSNGKPWKPKPTFEQSVEAARDRMIRLTARVNGCLVWQGSVNKAGYGKIKVAGRHLTTHRLAYVLAHGVIPKGALVCHSCDNPGCCDPDHLWLGTHLSNMRDKIDKGRCSRGEAHAIATKRGGQRPMPGSAHGRSILVESQIPELRKMYRDKLPLRVIGDKFGVSKQTVIDAARGATWRHVKEGLLIESITNGTQTPSEVSGV